MTTAGNSWGWGARSARLNVSGKSEDGTAGFNMGIYNDAFKKSISDGDEANLWIKPHDMVKVSYGYYDNNTLRGDCCYGSWNWMRPVSSWIAEDEGLLMSGLSGKALGLLGEITPMENLYIQAFAPIATENKADDTYKKLRAGFAYTIPGTAKIKAQYIGNGVGSKDVAAVPAGNGPDTDNVVGYLADGTKVYGGKATEAKAAYTEDGNSNCTLEAEVDLLAVENLFLGVGFQYKNVKDGKDLADKAITEAKNEKDAIDAAGKYQNMKVALGASYQINEDLKVSASGAFFTYYSDKAKVDPRFQAGAGVDYNLGDGLSANADFRYLSPVKADGKKADNTDHIAFSAGVQKGFSNGYIGVAFQGQTNGGNFATGDGAGVTGKEADKFTWAIPVALSVWF